MLYQLLRRQQRKLQNFPSILLLTFSFPDFFLPETKEAGQVSNFSLCAITLLYFRYNRITLFFTTMLGNLETQFYRGGRGRDVTVCLPLD